eukprot:TRINITY_DN2607_c0_g1_i1.p1 TRINITY_DN2607_c0_g1~~TRINITY_DN2607_c0_g1_i1.p1  ORF type:complete len:418 (-),score=97.57 TRINITY_DN2607_c0_g1_i1:221-1441(-)
MAFLRSPQAPQTPPSPGWSGKCHRFSIHTFKKPRLIPCAVCNRTLWGVYQQGQKCSDCGQRVHNDCLPQAGDCATLYAPFFLGGQDPIVKPLYVFVNPKSGGQEGLEVLEMAAAFLGDPQVVNMAQVNPAEALRTLVTHGSFPRCQLLVCGGDGTVGWVLSILDDLGARHEPAVAVLPLGTGNDLARALGWGGGGHPAKFRKVLDRLFLGVPVKLDRWVVSISGQPDHKMNNYFSVGADANISLGFHEAREKSPSAFQRREYNKAMYLKNAVDTAKAGVDLAPHLTVHADGRPIPLPKDVAALVVLNIPSYGAGADLWGSPKHYRPQSYGDMLLEVCTVSGVSHLGAVQAGTRSGDPLCQCRSLSIGVTRECPMQVDGEPWLQPPTLVEIRFLRQSSLLRYNPPTR